MPGGKSPQPPCWLVWQQAGLQARDQVQRPGGRVANASGVRRWRKRRISHSNVQRGEAPPPHSALRARRPAHPALTPRDRQVVLNTALSAIHRRRIAPIGDQTREPDTEANKQARDDSHIPIVTAQGKRDRSTANAYCATSTSKATTPRSPTAIAPVQVQASGPS